MTWRILRKYSLHAVILVLCLIILYRSSEPCPGLPLVSSKLKSLPRKQVQFVDSQLIKHDRNDPLVFIGGMPRSGTTLARVILDAHPAIRCGEETRVVPRVLMAVESWQKNPNTTNSFIEGGVTDQVLNNALSQFILNIIVKHGRDAKHLCNKDPFTLTSAGRLVELFPNSKFIFMVRDGRATVHSLITRKVTISSFDLRSFRQCMERWNDIIGKMYKECDKLGNNRCLRVYYEQLVLHPQSSIEKILHFLDIPWNESVMHHEQFINKPGGISVSKAERSSDQVIKPVNLDALSNWVGKIPQDVVDNMSNIAPMLATLGYDPKANPPNYGKPDQIVLDNTRKIQNNSAFWQGQAVEVLAQSKKIPA